MSKLVSRSLNPVRKSLRQLLQPNDARHSIRLLGANGRTEASEELFQRTQKTAEDRKALFSAYLHTKELQKASNLAVEGDTECLLGLLKLNASQGNITMANKLFLQMPLNASAQDKSAAYTSLIQCYAVRGLPGDALRTYRNMRSKGLVATHETLEHMICSHLPQKSLKGAIKWFYKKENVTGFIPSVGMHAALIEAYILQEDSIGGFKVLKQALSTLKDKHKSSNFQIPLQLVSSIARAIDGKPIEYLRERVRLSGLSDRMKSVVLARIMEVLAESNPKQTLEIFGEYTIKDGCASNSYIPYGAYAQVIKAHSMLGDTKEMLTVFKRIADEPEEPREDIYEAIIAGFARNNDQRALEYFKEYTEKKLPTARMCDAVLGIEPLQDEFRQQVAALADKEMILPDTKEHPRLVKALQQNGFTLLPSAFKQ